MIEMVAKLREREEVRTTIAAVEKYERQWLMSMIMIHDL